MGRTPRRTVRQQPRVQGNLVEKGRRGRVHKNVVAARKRTTPRGRRRTTARGRKRSGFFSAEGFKRHLPPPYAKHEYFICGPGAT
jgi:hypothetical protein